MTIENGTRLGRYEIRSKLGEGGMGEVYLAEDMELRRRVALKVLPADVASNQDRMRRFKQEAQAAAALNHPNIAHIYEIGESAGTNFIAMEFVDGHTLRELIHARQTELPRLLRTLQHVAEGLAKAHAAGIVHRDLKPDNVMVTRDGHAKILDFGLAKLVEKGPQPGSADALSEVATALMQQHSTPGAILGTVGYMSPEQAQGRIDEIDHRSDIFSFGCILFEAITGQKPFQGKDPIDSLNKIIREPAPPITTFNPSAPTDLQRIVRRCLAKDPEERYQTIKDVAIELKEVRRELRSETAIDTTVPPATTSMGATLSGGSIVSGQTMTSERGAPSTNLSSAEYMVTQVKAHKTGLLIGLGVIIVLIIGVVFGLLKFLGRDKAPTSARRMEITRLVTGLTGRPGSISISPDGKYVAYAVWEAGKAGLWIRQVSQATSLQIVPSEEGAWYGTTAFSKDSELIYFVAGNNKTNTRGALYQIPVLGGREPKKMVDHVDSQISLSPDGKQLVFGRAYDATGETAMFIANMDGSGERKLLSRRGENWLNGGFAWSPDGKELAFTGGTSKGGTVFTLNAMPPEGGPERVIANHKWTGDLIRVLWVDDGKGLIVNAMERADDPIQLWHVSSVSGEAERITNDLNEYGGISLSVTADSSTIATILSEWSSKIWVAAAGDDELKAKRITNGKLDGRNGVAYLPDGRIVYAARVGENSDLWIMNADGSSAKPLTSDAFVDSRPAITSDGRYIVYQSFRPDNVPHIWRMNSDGSNPKQLTTGGEDHSPTVSPDGQWVVFVSWRSGNAMFWKVPIDGGEPVRFSDLVTRDPIFSPDGKSLAGMVYDESVRPPRFRPASISFADGQLIKIIDLPFTAASPAWSRDGKDLLYLDSRADVANIWSLTLAGGAPKQLTKFTSEFMDRFDISPDGKHFVVSRSTGNNDIVLIKNFR